DKWNNHKFDIAEFKRLFKGVVLTAESSESHAIVETASAFFTTITTPAIAASLALILFSLLFYHTAYFTGLNWQLLALTLFKTLGLMTSILLLIQSIDSNNPLVQVLCQTKGKTNCNAILSSKAAKVTDWLTWSEVGFFYFAGTWLLVLFGGGSVFTWQMLAILNFISLPYTFYSVYYQARVAKQWCVLCCTVQALLWLEFIPLITYRNLTPLSFVQGTPFGGEGWGEDLATLLTCFAGPAILWALLKPLLLKVQQLQPLKQQLRKFKYNTELFNQMLTAQPKYTQPDEEWSIVLGNREAENVITMVSNPYCPPCAKMHKVLDELLEERGNLQARIVFTANNTDTDIKTPVSRHLVALNEMPDKTKVKQALNDWYEQKQKNYDAWAKEYPVALNGIEYDKIDKQKAWCELAEVTATPTMLLNGYRLPDLYQLPDLKYMLE
ncbi:MAG: thioredoxin domain-containing protein, partial [Bacteroidota bacterium]|nr:thioredoxin domain-containing protein [Bacteroidota bacterium]